MIRRFLLFKEGDPYSPEILAETERNLRALPFLRSARITAEAPHDGVVDIVVVTQDVWSIEPGGDASTKGGASTLGMRVTDSNVAGSGQQLSLSYNKATDRSRVAIDYRNPSLFAPYWRSRLLYARLSDGYDRRLAIGRPFYSTAAPWAFDFALDDWRQTDHLYADGLPLRQFRQAHRQAVASFGYALDASISSARRISFGIRAVDDKFSDLPQRSDALPDNRTFRYLFARFDRVASRWATLDYVDRDMRLQDFDLGNRFSAEAAISPRMGSSTTTEFLRMTDSAGHTLGGSALWIGSLSTETRFQGSPRNTIVTAAAKLIKRLPTAQPQTFVARLAFNSGWRLDRDTQFAADADTGLRGYRLHAFQGSRSIVANAEQRIYLGRELLQVVSPSVVFFADSGMATNRGLGTLAGLRTDVGAGIRLGLPRSTKSMLRFDLAYPLRSRDRRGPMVSISSSQAF